MTRDELILRTRQLIAEGERLAADPSLNALQTWLQLSDDLLATAWGSMDRYHLAWLMVGKPKGIVRGRLMTREEEASYVREVAAQKTAALRMSLDAVERQGMPFRGETGGFGQGQGMGAVPGTPGEGPAPDPEPGARPLGAGSASDAAPSAEPVGHAHTARGSRRSIPLDPELAARLEAARRAAAEHPDHAVRRAPRPERLQR
jgi:hypothetical protein